MPAVFYHGPITFDAIAAVNARRFVQLTEKGVKHAEPTKHAFGAVAHAAAPHDAERKGIIPDHVAVFTAPSVIELDVDGEDNTIPAGKTIEVGTDGKAKAKASGVPVAIAVRPAAGGKVEARLLTPVLGK